MCMYVGKHALCVCTYVLTSPFMQSEIDEYVGMYLCMYICMEVRIHMYVHM